jgi:hypothetical protein
MTTKMPKKDDTVRVTWRDAHSDERIREDLADVNEDYLVVTVGIVISAGPKFLRIADEHLPNEDGWRGVSSIPVENLTKIEKLVPEE